MRVCVDYHYLKASLNKQRYSLLLYKTTFTSNLEYIHLGCNTGITVSRNVKHAEHQYTPSAYLMDFALGGHGGIVL